MIQNRLIYIRSDPLHILLQPVWCSLHPLTSGLLLFASSLHPLYIRSDPLYILLHLVRSSLHPLISSTIFSTSSLHPVWSSLHPLYILSTSGVILSASSLHPVWFSLHPFYIRSDPLYILLHPVWSSLHPRTSGLILSTSSYLQTKTDLNKGSKGWAQRRFSFCWFAAL